MTSSPTLTRDVAALDPAHPDRSAPPAPDSGGFLDCRGQWHSWDGEED